MIGTIFEFGGQMVEVRIIGNNCLFRTGQFGGGFVPIDNLQLEKAGCIREHPDLKEKKDWKQETIKRFKEKIDSFDTEIQRMKYVIEDLKKHGYKPRHMQREGFRPIKIK